MQVLSSAMDFDSSSKFISSLAKFLQSLCNGYVEFNSGVEVIGHIYLSVDTGKKIDYILNEKVCKTDENSVTFISNSFHAQPAEKPKPPEKKTAPTSDPIRLVDTSSKSEEEDIIIMEQPESKNVGTIPPKDSFQHQNPSSHLKPIRPHKRSFNQSFPSSHRHSVKQIKSDFPSGSNGTQLDTDSLHSESNSSSNFLPPQLVSDATITAATESDISHLSKVFPQTFNDSVNSQNAEEERDVKPQLDSDLKVIQVKQEYDQSAHVGEEDPEMFDDSQDQNSSFPSMSYDQYYAEGIKRGQRSDYGHIGGMAQGDFFPHGAGPSVEAVSGDSSGSSLWISPGEKSLSSLPSQSILTSARLSQKSGTNSSRMHSSSAILPVPHHMSLPLDRIKSDVHKVRVSSYNPKVKQKRKMNFECEVCGKRFCSRRDYVGHMSWRHLGEKPFACEHCGRHFAYITSLPMHKKTCPAVISQQ